MAVGLCSYREPAPAPQSDESSAARTATWIRRARSWPATSGAWASSRTRSSTSSRSRPRSTTGCSTAPLDFLAKNEDDLSARERALLKALVISTGKLPQPARQAIFDRFPAPYGVTGVCRGRDRGGAREDRSEELRAVPGADRGPGGRLVLPIPYISPYNVHAFLNPLLVQVLAQGYLFNLYRGAPLVKKGGTLDHHAPLHRQVRSRAARAVHRLRAPPAAGDARRGRAPRALRGEVRRGPGVHPDVPHAATPTTRPTRSSCGTGARTAASTSAA